MAGPGLVIALTTAVQTRAQSLPPPPPLDRQEGLTTLEQRDFCGRRGSAVQVQAARGGAPAVTYFVAEGRSMEPSDLNLWNVRLADQVGLASVEVRCDGDSQVVTIEAPASRTSRPGLRIEARVRRAALTAPALFDFSGQPCRDPSLRPGEYIDEHLIYFGQGSAKILTSGSAKMVLQSAACQILRGARDVRVIAHTDTSGSAEHNRALSLRRASTVAEALAELGVDRALIRIEARGETAPAVPTGDDVPEALNRRAIIDWR